MGRDMNKTITLRHLRCFMAVAQTRSFTQAAQRVYLTQSSLTTTIRQLEESLGLRLFDRTTRQVSLTAAARHFQQHAEKLLRDFDMLIDDTRALANGYSGHLSIAAAPSIVVTVLAPALVEFRARSPGVSVSLRDAGSAEIEHRVLDGKVDFGVCSRLQNHPELEYRPLLRDRYGVVCSADHPLAALERPVTWDDVSRYRSDWVGLASDTLVGRVHKQILGDDAPSAYLEELSSTSMLGPMLALGNRFSIIPGLTQVAHQLDFLRFLDMAPPHIERELCLVTRRLRSLSPAASTLLACMFEELTRFDLPAGMDLVQEANTGDLFSPGTPS